MRVEEHSLEARVAFAEGGRGGWSAGSAGGLVVLDLAWACCSHMDLVLGSTGHEDSEDAVDATGRAAGDGGGGGWEEI